MPLAFPQSHEYAICVSSDAETVVRANLSSEAEADEWVKTFGQCNSCCWISGRVYRHSKTTTKFVAHKRWLCHHNEKGKKVDSKRSTGCRVGIDILIKNITRQTKYTDKYLTQSPPLQAIITIRGTHNHFTDTAESLRMLRTSAGTKADFEGYFNNGLSAAEAIRFHQDKLEASGDSSVLLANSSINPTARMVYYWHELHRRVNYSSSNVPLVKLEERRSLYAEPVVQLCEQSMEEQLEEENGNDLERALSELYKMSSRVAELERKLATAEQKLLEKDLHTNRLTLELQRVKQKSRAACRRARMDN